MLSNDIPYHLNNDLFLTRTFILALSLDREGIKLPPLDLDRVAFTLWIRLIE